VIKRSGESSEILTWPKHACIGQIELLAQIARTTYTKQHDQARFQDPLQSETLPAGGEQEGG
jgi:hypothetical protein